VFTDSGVGILFEKILVQYGSEYLYNQIEANTQDSFAVIQVASAPASKTTYGLRSLNINGLLNATDEGALEVAKDLLTYYYQPELRVESITVNLKKLTTEQKQQVLALEIDSYISVSFTPNGIGDPKINSGLVTGISHNITTTTHEVELNLRTERNLFTLNSESKGILDEDILGP
jgi:autonomous glycyl radical cofactor GrcA